MNRRFILPIALAVVLVAGGGWVFLNRAAAGSQTQTFSGTIEADEVDITGEISGKIDGLGADEGARVKAGDVLLKLNTDLLQAQLAQARAALQAAEANLELTNAGSRPEDIAQAEAALAQAQATRDGAARALGNAREAPTVAQAEAQLTAARTAYANAVRTLRNPQELQTAVIQSVAQRDLAQATRDQAQTNAQAARDRLSAAKTEAQVALDAAAAALQSAQARYALAKDNWQYASENGVDPITPKIANAQGKQVDNKLSDGARESYYAAFVQAEAALRQAEQAVAQAQTAYDAARQAEASGVAAADQQVQSAETALTNAQAALDQSRAIQAHPQQLQAAVDAAQAQVDSATVAVEAARVQYQNGVDSATAQLAAAEAQVAQATSRLDAARNGNRPEQIRVAEAQVAQAQAQVQQIQVQIDKANIRSPVDGIVLERLVNLGEQASPGTVLMRVGPLNNLKLTIYIPEDRIGPLHLSQGVHVSVQVDSFAGRGFDGTITYIAPEAEFTPRNVQTKEERATTVFPVRITLANPDGALKPGMPADATIATH